MARYPAGARGRRVRNRMYTIVALVAISAVFIYLYGFSHNETETAGDGPPLNANPDINVLPTGMTKPVIGDETAVQEVPESTNFSGGYSSGAGQAEFEPSRVEVVPPSNRGLEASDTVQPDPELVKESSLVEIPSGPTVEPNPEAEDLIQEADALLKKTPAKIIEARDKLNMILQMPMSVQQRNSVKKKLSELANKWLFSRTVYPDDLLCDTYKVGKGEILAVIGEKNKVPYQILMTVNNITDPRSIQAGQLIKLIKGPFHAKVYRSTFTMDVYLQTTYIRSFVVGLGLPGQETPTGLWRVKPGGKLEKPIWTNPLNGRTYFPEDPDYPLGSRWIGLEGLQGEAKDKIGFAIHGTKDPQQLGTQGSQGCIRLENGNAILVYNMLFPGESLVEVTD
jgi:lipoprotein-anchoring transpeptidase ErfK/SrfK